ncbi:MAG: hypothetical protein RL398_2239 [Planctomycetota bacterium]
MAERLRWWVIPGAVLVLARVVTLPPRDVSVLPSEATAKATFVVARDAAGHRQPLALPATSARALRLSLPTELVGERVQVVLWRLQDGVREPAEWLRFSCTLRPDALVPILGLPAGEYDVEAEAAGRAFLAVGAAMPDTVTLVAKD